MASTRRDFVKNTGLGVLAFNVGGKTMMLTPAEAHANKLSFQVFDAAQATLLESFGHTLVPGSPEAGLAHFVDLQLAGSSGDTKLAVRYLGLDTDYRQFYHQGLDLLDSLYRSKHGKPFVEDTQVEKDRFVHQLLEGEIPEQEASILPKFYYAVRSDAVDVVYGTQSGIERLKVPYMPHIIPPSDWG